MEFPPFNVFAPIEILLEAKIAPKPARYPMKTPFFTFEVEPPAPVPTKVSLLFAVVARIECVFPAPIPTYTFPLASPTAAANVFTIFADTASILISSNLDWKTPFVVSYTKVGRNTFVNRF